MGSPRKNSNTHTLLLESERALRERGYATEIVFIDDLSLRDCRGCHGCKQPDNDRCIMQDDMQQVYRLMDESASIILAAPVYFGYVPAQTKAWLDRLVPYIGTDLGPKITGGKRVSFIFTQNMPDTGMFEQSLKGFMNSVAMTGLIVADYLIAPDCEMGQKPPVTERSDIMERAYVLGKNLAE